MPLDESNRECPSRELVRRDEVRIDGNDDDREDGVERDDRERGAFAGGPVVFVRGM
jgi:hypothetical protein